MILEYARGFRNQPNPSSLGGSFCQVFQLNVESGFGRIMCPCKTGPMYTSQAAKVMSIEGKDI